MGVPDPWSRDPSRIAWLLLALTLGAWTAAPHARGQTVVGHLTDAASAQPVVGALVLLLDEAGQQRAGTLSDPTGRFVLRAPQAGRYRLRSERIGFEDAVVEALELAAGGTLRRDVAMTSRALELEGISVEGDRRCRLMGDEGPLVARLWDEAAKALRNQRWAEQAQLIRFEVVEYEREADPSTRLVLWEERGPSEWVTGNPIRSLPAEDLLRDGFIRRADSGFHYYGPDAAVLLSDLFLEEHCIRLADSSPRQVPVALADPSPDPAATGLADPSPDRAIVGLAFEPLRRGRVAGIAGTLWLDRATAAPRALDFHYTSAPWAEASGVAEGRVEFEELPEGVWMVRSWWIRMPKMVRDQSRMSGGRSGLRVDGLLEAGGEVVGVHSEARPAPAEAPAGRLAPTAPTGGRSASAAPPGGELVGVVWDSARAAPLAGAEVYLSGTGQAAVTDREGRYRMTGVPEGSYLVAFRSPRLDSVGVYPRGVEVVVRRDGAARADLAVPSRRSTLMALCAGEPGDDGQSVVVGTVRDGGAGEGVAGATVELEWSEYRGSLETQLVTDVRRIQVETDRRGRYRACGIPAGVLLTARARAAGERAAVARVEVPREDVVVLDLTLGREDSVHW